MLIFLYSLSGHLLDATHQYMYIFLLAGCQVTLSAFVISLGNLLCMSRKQKDLETKMAVSAAEMEMLNCGVKGKGNGRGEERLKEQDNGQVGALELGEMMILKELGKESSGGENTLL